MKQTAVEWLEKELIGEDGINVLRDIFNQAKELEKQQIINSYLSDRFPWSDEEAEQYYNETFKKL